MSVKDTYGLNSVTKFEGIGHVQKRVGSRLRKLKTKTKGLSGKGKLTDNFIDRLQNYGIAVRSNVGNLTAMQQNVIAALYHCASSDKKPMHGQWPIGKETWCYFQRGVPNGTKCSTKYAGISNDVLNKIKPVYLELCDKQILKEMDLGPKMPELLEKQAQLPIEDATEARLDIGLHWQGNVGARVVGCCAHVISVLWYLGYWRYNHTQTKTPNLGYTLQDAANGWSSGNSASESQKEM
ncbi:uncharacterized protein TNCV_1622031 [Trichonephila clavipes]|nr:uncharacterized protein TNCV_1622031 [Trichonephila clavipes]